MPRTQTLNNCEAPAGTNTLQRGLLLLETVQQYQLHGGVSRRWLLKEFQCPEATLDRSLRTLRALGWVRQSAGDDKYFLGDRAVALGSHVADEGRRREAAAMAKKLAQETGEVIFVTERDGNDTVCHVREEGAHQVRTNELHEGDRHPLGVGGGSIALLAACPDNEVDVIVAANAATITQRYGHLFDLDRIRSMVQHARDQEFAFNDGMMAENSHSVGVALPHPSGRPLIALSVAAPSDRMTANGVRYVQLLWAARRALTGIDPPAQE